MRETNHICEPYRNCVKIENIVCSGSFNQPLNLLELSRSGDVEYDPEMYHGGYIKTNGHSVPLYRSGKYIMPGMKDMDDVRATFAQVKEILEQFCDTSLFSEPEIRNMVCTSNVGRSLDLATLFIELINEGYDASYEPESFPGLILKEEDVTFNIFSSGKFIILGCKSEASAQESESRVLNLINSH